MVTSIFWHWLRILHHWKLLEPERERSMFMSTNVSTYYLPLYGAQINALGTEIGADHRSIFVRPITAIGENTVAADPGTAETTAVPDDYERFDNWLASYSAYRRAAAGSDAPAPSQDSAAGASDDSAPVPAPASDGTTPPTSDAQSAEGSPESQQASQTGQQETAAGGSTDNGGLLGALLGWNRR